MSTVYFAQSGEHGNVKIGTSQNWESRIAQLQTSHPEKLRVLAVIQGDRQLESHLHRMFKFARVSGEWFYPRGPVALAKALGDAKCDVREWKNAVQPQATINGFRVAENKASRRWKMRRAPIAQPPLVAPKPPPMWSLSTSSEDFLQTTYDEVKWTDSRRDFLERVIDWGCIVLWEKYHADACGFGAHLLWSKYSIVADIQHIGGGQEGQMTAAAARFVTGALGAAVSAWKLVNPDKHQTTCECKSCVSRRIAAAAWVSSG